LVGDLDRTGESDGVMMISTLLAELQTDKLWLQTIAGSNPARV
jgi:hypothetical protein